MKTLSSRNYDALKTDVWALGVLFFVLVRGTFPFGMADTQDKWFKTIYTGNWITFWRVHERQSRLTFSNELKQLIEMMLTINPDDRPTLNEVATASFFRNEKEEDIDQEDCTAGEGLSTLKLHSEKSDESYVSDGINEKEFNNLSELRTDELDMLKREFIRRSDTYIKK